MPGALSRACTVRRIAASTRFQRGERRARHLRLLRLAALAGAKRPPLGGRRFPCGSERTRARAAPPSRWSRASLAALCSRAPRRAACGCGRNDTRTGLRRKDSDSTTSSRSTPTWRLDYASSVATSAGGGLLPRRPARTPAVGRGSSDAVGSGSCSAGGASRSRSASRASWARSAASASQSGGGGRHGCGGG
jgi:hypothetical protein